MGILAQNFREKNHKKTGKKALIGGKKVSNLGQKQTIKHWKKIKAQKNMGIFEHEIRNSEGMF